MLVTAKPIPFIVASTPRSGTSYTNEVLNLCGVPCVHEEYFDIDCQMYYPESGRGCVSWLSVPFLRNLPPETLVLHQVRDPVRTINALIETHNLRHGDGPNMPFLRQHHTPTGTLPEAEFWYDWHRRIDEFAVLTYRVEEMPLTAILELLQHDVPKATIHHALTRVSRNFNTYGPVSQHVTWNGLTEKVRVLANSYGY